MKLNKIILLALMVFGLAGCGVMQPIDFSNGTLPPLPVEKVKAQKTLSAPDVKDLRGEALNVIGQFEKTTAITGLGGGSNALAWHAMAKQPVSDVIAKALKEGLIAAHYHVRAKGAHYLLQVNLLSTKLKLVESVESSTLYCNLLIGVMLVNAQTKHVAWQRTFFTQGYAQDQSVVLSSSDLQKAVKKAFQRSLQKLVKNVVSASEFQVVLR